MRRRAGFTLIEMVAVLAILAILAGAIAPSVSHQLRDARLDAEGQNLTTFSGLLRDHVRRNGNIPSALGWGAALAALSDLPATSITQNQDNQVRAYIPDPAWTPAGMRPVAAGGWTQTPAAADAVVAAPANARILLVSDLDANAQANCAAMTAAQFDAVWNQTAAAPPSCVDGPSRKVARINLGGEFVLVTRNVSNPLGPPPPAWTLSGVLAAAVPFAAPGVTNRWLLRGSRLDLVGGGAISGEIVVRDPVSATWNGAAWSGF